MAGVFLIARRWRSLLVFSITAATLILISFWMVRWQGPFDLISILRSMQKYSFVVRPALMPNIRGVTNALLRTEEFEAVAATIILSLALYALCLYFWRGQFDVACSAFDLKFSLTVVTTVLISYHLYAHDLFPLALSLVLLFRYISSTTAHFRALSKLFYGLVLVFLVPVMPRYLIESGIFWSCAVPITLLYLILSAEILKWRWLEVASSGPNRHIPV